MEKQRVNLEALEKPHWTDVERQNAEHIAAFIQLLMIDHDFDEVEKRFGGGSYVQHSRGIPDGIAGLVAYVRDLTTRFPEYTYDVKRIDVDGDHVTFHSHATLKASHRGDDRQGFNIIDSWRVDSGEIIEHWDAIQPLSLAMRLFAVVAGGRIANDNGVY